MIGFCEVRSEAQEVGFVRFVAREVIRFVQVVRFAEQV